jgi:LPS export ABC transporter protein LptC
MVSPGYIRRVLALLVVAAAAGVTFAIFHGTRGTSPTQPVNQQLPRNVDVSLKKARFSEIRDGRLVWELVADQVDYDKEGDRAYLSDILMEFQGNEPQESVRVTADRGEYASSDANIRLNGTIRVTTDKGARFETDSILYTGANDQISTEDPVKFQQQRLHLTAIGMDLGVKNQLARFHSAINASLSTD